VNGLEVSFYGDDFTGSTDVMEVLEQSGVPTVLFLDPPSPERVATLEGVRAVGVAGISRTMPPEQMDAELGPILTSIRALGAPLFHYKICSTFDSAPHRGSIGRAAEIVRRLFPGVSIPIVVGVPQLGRYTVFGTLFAMFRGELYRLDRHPAMSVHPSTPMSEADLRRVLAEQTDLEVDVVDVRHGDSIEERLAQGRDLVLLDVASVEQQHGVGRALSAFAAGASSAHPRAVIGSSGVEYALAAAELRPLVFAPRGGETPLPTLVVVGSRAPATAAQTKGALEAGFHGVCVDPSELITAPGRSLAAAREAAGVLARGEDAIVYLNDSGASPVDGVELGRALGSLAAAIADQIRIQRLVVAGGDTSGLVARALGIEALSVLRLLAPGAPLCRALSSDPRTNDMQVCLKGGAIGDPTFFVQVARGQPVPR
jgi:uncharacterized protein YgbK (DUF1537 family)